MCRIFGYMGKSGVSKTTLESVSKAQLHGGPDQQSVMEGEGWALGNNRLIIQGRSGGRQPFTIDGLAHIQSVFNGEIYNHDALRKKLEDRGYRFSDNCDGNVILPLYLEYGDEAFVQMEGMFAIAIVDTRSHPCITIANDPFAIKSIYYCFDQARKSLFFASEIHALLQFDFKNPVVEVKGIDAFFTMRTPCGEDTILDSVKTLGPGRILKFRPCDNAPQIRHYQAASKHSFHPGDDYSGLLERELANNITLLSRAEVPVCFINSGGLDSSLLTAMAAEITGQKITSFHVCYKGNWPSDERHYARIVADFVGADHHEVELDPNDFPDIIPEFVSFLGQPNSAPHCLSSFGMFRQIRKNGFTVAIAGEGADEVFIGYDRFLRAFDEDPDWIDRYLAKFGAFAPSLKKKVYSKDLEDRLFRNGYCEDGLKVIMQKTVPGERRLEALVSFDQQERFSYYILRRTDHMSMAHAVEVRVPFCQPGIVQFGNGLPVDQKTDGKNMKKVLTEVGRRYLPAEITDRRKQPFTLPILAIMLENRRMADFIRDVFHSRAAFHSPFLDGCRIRELFSDFQSNPSEDMAQLVWSTLIFILWNEWYDKTVSARTGR
jgi:asparagine synthase (glutamine-hydrolysing)